MKNAMFVIKMLDRSKGILNLQEKRISELEDTVIEIIQNET